MSRPVVRDANGFTPIQAALWEVLADGLWHRRGELTAIVDDDRHVLRYQINRMRKIVEPKGLMIIYQICTGAGGGIGLQVVRRLSSVRSGGG